VRQLDLIQTSGPCSRNFPETDNILFASVGYGTYKRKSEAEEEKKNILIASGGYGLYKRRPKAEAEIS
jgi:hypothetical protein